MTCGGRALVCAMLLEANWSRSSSFWDTSRFKRPSDTMAASSGYGRRSMIASESNQIPESRGSGRVADKPGAIPSFNDMDVIRLGARFQLVESSRDGLLESVESSRRAVY